MRRDVGYSRGIAVDAGNAVDWDHPLNVGRSCWYVAPPGIPTGGRLNDITGKASSGTFVNGPKWSPSNSGISGILFDDASSQSVSLPSSICPVGASPFSILLTLKVSKTPPTIDGAIAFSIGVSPSSNRGIGIFIDTSVRPAIDTAAIGKTTGTAVKIGANVRVCATYDGTTLSLYQDGVFRASNSRSLNITASSLAIGSNQYYAPGYTFFPGVISDLSTYSTRCLTRNDVRQDFLYQSSGYAVPDSPLHWFSTRSYSLPGGGSDGVGTATGTSTASGAGSSAAASVASTSGTGTASGVGAAASASVASASGTSSTSGIGAGSAAGVASADGTSTVSGVGISASAGVASASGTATVSGVGSSTTGSESVGTAAGTSTASAVGTSTGSSGSIGTAEGTSTASAVSASAVAAIFSAVGTSTANGVSPGGLVVDGRTGTAYDMGTRTASAVDLGSRTASAVDLGSRTAANRLPNPGGITDNAGSTSGTGSAAGTSTAAAVGESIVYAVGTAAGTSTASGVGDYIVSSPSLDFSIDTNSMYIASIF